MNQREYRFILLASASMMKIDSIVFHVEEPDRYIEQVFLGPDVSQDEKR
jgi:hypothetical protein